MFRSGGRLCWKYLLTSCLCCVCWLWSGGLVVAQGTLPPPPTEAATAVPCVPCPVDFAPMLGPLETIAACVQTPDAAGVVAAVGTVGADVGALVTAQGTRAAAVGTLVAVSGVVSDTLPLEGVGTGRLVAEGVYTGVRVQYGLAVVLVVLLMVTIAGVVVSWLRR